MLPKSKWIPRGAAVLFQLLLAVIYGVNCTPLSYGPPPSGVTSLTANFYFTLLGSTPATMDVDFEGCLLANDGNCPAQGMPGSDTFSKVVTQSVKPSCDKVGPSCIAALVSTVVTGIKPGRWRVSASTTITALVSCSVLVMGGTGNTVYLNVFNSDPALRCEQATSSTTITESFNVNPESRVVATHGSSQEVIQVTGGKINFADPAIIHDMNLSMADVSIRGVAFHDIQLRSTRPFYLDLSQATANAATLLAGNSSFELSFVGNGAPVRMSLIGGDMSLVRSGKSLQLHTRFDVTADPGNLLPCPFASLGDVFPFTVDADVTATDPPVQAGRRRLTGKP